jgi:hypothetical protein
MIPRAKTTAISKALTKKRSHPRFWNHGHSGAEILIECFERFDPSAAKNPRLGPENQACFRRFINSQSRGPARLKRII